MVLFTIIALTISLAVLISVFYQYVIRTWTYFIERNVKFIRGFPLLGSAYRAVAGLEAPAISYQRCYDQYPAERFIGIYDIAGRPLYLLRDPKLIAQIQTMHSDNFMPKMSGACRGNETDVKRLHGIVDNCSERFVEAIKETDRNAKLFDARDLFTRYANDVIAATAFGIELNSMRQPSCEMLLIDNLVGQSSFNRSISQSVKVLLQLINVSIEKSERKVSLLENVAKRNGIQDGFVRNGMINAMVNAPNADLQKNGKSLENVGNGVEGEAIILTNFDEFHIFKGFEGFLYFVRVWEFHWKMQKYHWKMQEFPINSQITSISQISSIFR